MVPKEYVRRAAQRFLLRPAIAAQVNGEDILLLNISVRGALVSHTTAFPVGARIRMRVQIGESRVPLTLTGKLLWTRDASAIAEGFASGIAFDAEVTALRSAIDHLCAASGAIAMEDPHVSEPEERQARA